MKKFLASVAAVALMGGAAAAQNVVLVPQGHGPGGQQQFILVPIPQDQGAMPQGAGQQGSAQQGAGQQGAGQQQAGQQQMRDRAEAMALDLYRRGYQRGMADAQSASGPGLDPGAMEQIGRELFERGYMLGLMQARAQITAEQTPQPGDDAQDARQGQADAGQGGQQTPVTPGQIAEAAKATPEAGQIGAQGQAGQTGQESGQTAGQQQVTPEQIAQAAQGTPDAGQVGAQGEAGQTGQAADGQVAGATTAGEFPQAIIRAQSSEEYGQYLVDANGRPVYVLEADRQGEGDETFESTCQDDCAAAWPPVLTQGTPPRAMGGADEGMLSTTEREDGTTQVTYNGWPLYYYVRDEGANRPTGQDVHDEWGEWYLLEPNGEMVGED